VPTEVVGSGMDKRKGVFGTIGDGGAASAPGYIVYVDFMYEKTWNSYNYTYLLNKGAHNLTSDNVFRVSPQSKNIICPEALHEISDPFIFFQLSPFILSFGVRKGFKHLCKQLVEVRRQCRLNPVDTLIGINKSLGGTENLTDPLHFVNEHTFFSSSLADMVEQLCVLCRHTSQMFCTVSPKSTSSRSILLDVFKYKLTCHWHFLLCGETNVEDWNSPSPLEAGYLVLAEILVTAILIELQNPRFSEVSGGGPVESS